MLSLQSSCDSDSNAKIKTSEMLGKAMLLSSSLLSCTHHCNCLLLLLQVTMEGLVNLYWTPSDCSGAAIQMLLSTITYDITPPTLAIVQTFSKGNTTIAQTASVRANRRLHYFTVSPTSSSSKTYGANVVFSFSEAVQGFGANYAFIHGGELSSDGLNESVCMPLRSLQMKRDERKVECVGSEVIWCEEG